MGKMQAGFTGFIPRGADYFSYLEKYAKVGFKVCESGFGIMRAEGDPKDNVKRVHDLGMKFFTLGASVAGDSYPDLAKLEEQAKLFEVDNVTMYHSSATGWRFADREMPDPSESMREIEKMNKLCGELKEIGLNFVFHNHDQEFITTINGVPLFWVMATLVPDLKFELDLAWAHYAGDAPEKIIEQLGSRVAALHVKDYTRGENYEYKPARTVTVPRYTTPGTGLVDLQLCFAAAVKADVPYAIIEQDMQYNLTHEESATTAYYIMKETGFVE